MRQNSIPAHVRRVRVQRAQGNARLRPQKRLLSMLLLLLTCVAASIICANVLTPQPASAVGEQGYGNDGYFSGLKAAKPDGSPVMPVVDAETSNEQATQTGWANTRRILFGKQKDTLNNSTSVYDNANVTDVSAGYKTLALGEIAPVRAALDRGVSDYNDSGTADVSLTTAIAANEALLWAEDSVTAGMIWSTGSDATCKASPPPNFTGCRGWFDKATPANDSNLTKVAQSSRDIPTFNYSHFEQGLLRSAPVNAVCTVGTADGCKNDDSIHTDSKNSYQVFPLSVGDVSLFLNHRILTNAKPTVDGSPTNPNVYYPGGTSDSAGANGVGTNGNWLRTPANLSRNSFAIKPDYTWSPVSSRFVQEKAGLRPAMRLQLDNLLLAAESTDQSQLPLTVTDADKDKSLRLTFADEGELVTRLKFDNVAVADGSDVQVEAGTSGTIEVSGSSTLDADADGWGWKIIDPAATDGSVLASGLTSGDGNITIPDSLVAWHDYELYVWAQENGSAEEGWSNRATEPVKITLEAVDSTVDLGADGYFSTLTSGNMPVSTGGYADTRRIIFGKQSSNGTYTGRTLTAGYKVLGVGAIASTAQNPFSSGNTTSSNTTLLGSKEALLFSQDTVTSAFRFTGDQNSAVFDSVIGGYSSSLAATSKQVGKQNYAPFEQKLLRSRPVEGVCGSTEASCESGSQPADNTSSFSYLTFPLSGGDLKTFMGHSSGDTADTNLSNNASYWLRSSKWDTTTNALYVNSEGGVQSTHAINAEAGLRPAFRLKLNRLVLAANNTDQSQTAGDTRLTFADMNATLSSVKVNGSTDLNAKVTVEQGQSLNVEGSSTLAAADGWGWKIINTAQPSVVVESGYVPGLGTADIVIPDTVRSGDKYELWFWQQHTGNASEGLSNQSTVPAKVPVRVLALNGPDGYFSELNDGTTPVLTSGKSQVKNILFGKTKDDSTHSNTAVWNDENVTTVSGLYKTLGIGPMISIRGNSSWSTSLFTNEALLFSNSGVTAGMKFNGDTPATNRFDWSDGYLSNLAAAAMGVATSNYSEVELSSLRADKLEGVCQYQQGCSSDADWYSPEHSLSNQTYQVFPLSKGDVKKYLVDGPIPISANTTTACENSICNNSTNGYYLRSPYGAGSSSTAAYAISSTGASSGTSGSDKYGLRPALRLSLKNLVLAAESTSQAQSTTGDMRLTFTQPTALLTMTTLTATKNYSGAIDLSLDGTSTGITQSGLGWKLVNPLSDTVEASGRTNSDVSTAGNMQIPSTVAAGDYDLYVWGQQDGSAEDGWSNIATKPLRTTLTINDSEEPTVEQELPTYPELPDYELIIPSGFVLDGTHRGEDSAWVGESDNVQLVVNKLSASSLKVSVNAEDGANFTLESQGGSATTSFKARQNDSSHTNTVLSHGSELFAIDQTGVSKTTLQVNWDDVEDKVPKDLKTGKYQGKLLFSVTEVN